MSCRSRKINKKRYQSEGLLESDLRTCDSTIKKFLFKQHECKFTVQTKVFCVVKVHLGKKDQSWQSQITGVICVSRIKRRVLDATKKSGSIQPIITIVNPEEQRVMMMQNLTDHFATYEYQVNDELFHVILSQKMQAAMGLQFLSQQDAGRVWRGIRRSVRLQAQTNKDKLNFQEHHQFNPVDCSKTKTVPQHATRSEHVLEQNHLSLIQNNQSEMKQRRPPTPPIRTSSIKPQVPSVDKKPKLQYQHETSKATISHNGHDYRPPVPPACMKPKLQQETGGYLTKTQMVEERTIKPTVPPKPKLKIGDIHSREFQPDHVVEVVKTVMVSQLHEKSPSSNESHDTPCSSNSFLKALQEGKKSLQMAPEHTTVTKNSSGPTAWMTQSPFYRSSSSSEESDGESGCSDDEDDYSSSYTGGKRISVLQSETLKFKSPPPALSIGALLDSIPLSSS